MAPAAAPMPAPCHCSSSRVLSPSWLKLGPTAAPTPPPMAAPTAAPASVYVRRRSDRAQPLIPTNASPQSSQNPVPRFISASFPSRVLPYTHMQQDPTVVVPALV